MTTLITRKDMVTKLKAIKGATMISLVAETIPKLKKTGNSLGDVVKIAHVNGVLNFNYQNAVNRQRKREGKTDDFKSQGRTWGQQDGAVVEKTDKAGNTKTYLQFKQERIISQQYKGVGGGIIPDVLVEAFLTGKKSKRQGTNKSIKICNYSLDNVKQIKMKGETFILT